MCGAYGDEANNSLIPMHTFNLGRKELYLIMATPNPKDQLGPCIHPNSAHYKDFFILRLQTFINGHSTKILVQDRCPVLYISEFDCSIELSKIAKELHLVLGQHDISLTRAFYDENFPVFAIDFPSPLTSQHVTLLQSKASNLSHKVSVIIRACIRHVDIQVEVRLELFLCSPSNDGQAAPRFTIINSDEVQDHQNVIDLYSKSKMFDFSTVLFNSSSSDCQGVVKRELFMCIAIPCSSVISQFTLAVNYHLQWVHFI